MNSPSRWGSVFGACLLLAPVIAVACTPCSPAPGKAESSAEQTARVERAELRKQFEAARAAKDWAQADQLYPKLLAIHYDEGSVRDYLLYERGRCGEVLQMLEAERKDTGTSTRIPEHPQMLSALVCEAARLESTDRAQSIALLGEALDKERSVFVRRSDLFYEFARQPTLYLPAMRFLQAHGFSRDYNGYAMESQIGDGRVDNVRQLLELGVDPNERHGGQHAGFGATREALKHHPAESLAIAKLLLEYGADPNMLVDYGDEEKPTTPEAKEFESLLGTAARRISAERPVRVDFVDYEALPQLGSESYARFDVLNNTDKTWNLGFVRTEDGIDYSMANVRFEYVVWPGTKWRTYEWQDHSAPATHSKPVVLGPWEGSLLRVPVSFYELMDAPPGLRLRLRIRASDGTDFVSAPFSLHDTTYVNNYWPKAERLAEGIEAAPTGEMKYGEPIPPLPRAPAIPAGMKAPEGRNAMHDRPERNRPN